MKRRTFLGAVFGGVAALLGVKPKNAPVDVSKPIEYIADAGDSVTVKCLLPSECVKVLAGEELHAGDWVVASYGGAFARKAMENMDRQAFGVAIMDAKRNEKCLIRIGDSV